MESSETYERKFKSFADTAMGAPSASTGLVYAVIAVGYAILAARSPVLVPSSEVTEPEKPATVRARR
jgi:hypothetical protein